MNTAALFNLTYGLYIIAANEGDRNVGCVVNTIVQISSKPVSIAISTNKDNYTTGAIMKAGKFTVSVLSENTPKTVIGTFGFNSSRDKNKFDEIKYKTLESGLPVITEEMCAYLECKVINSIDCHTHKIIIAEVTDADVLAGGKPMSYDYYHKVVKGTTPKNAATYVEKAPEPQPGGKYVCSVCGYEYPGTKEEFEALPDDYRCPICKVLKEKFVLS